MRTRWWLVGCLLSLYAVLYSLELVWADFPRDDGSTFADFLTLYATDPRNLVVRLSRRPPKHRHPPLMFPSPS